MALIHSKSCLIIQHPGLLPSPLGEGKHIVLTCSLYYRRVSVHGFMLPCDTFLRCLMLYTPNIKRKNREQEKKKHAVLQQTAVSFLPPETNSTENQHQLSACEVVLDYPYHSSYHRTHLYATLCLMFAPVFTPV